MVGPTFVLMRIRTSAAVTWNAQHSVAIWKLVISQPAVEVDARSSIVPASRIAVERWPVSEQLLAVLPARAVDVVDGQVLGCPTACARPAIVIKHLSAYLCLAAVVRLTDTYTALTLTTIKHPLVRTELSQQFDFTAWASAGLTRRSSDVDRHIRIVSGGRS